MRNAPREGDVGLRAEGRAAVFLEVFLGLGALGGGAALMAGPRGEILSISMSRLAGSPFATYFGPGLILFTVLGIWPLVVAFVSWRRRRRTPWMTLSVGLGLLIWMSVQIVIVGYGNHPPLQAGYIGLGVAIVSLGLVSVCR